MSFFLFMFFVFRSFLIFFINKKVRHEKSATWKKYNMEKRQHGNSKSVARPPQTSKIESFATMFNGLVNYCYKTRHLSNLRGSCLHLWKYCNMKIVQQEKIATRKECNKKIQNKNTATCKSATWNSATNKRV